MAVTERYTKRELKQIRYLYDCWFTGQKADGRKARSRRVKAWRDQYLHPMRVRYGFTPAGEGDKFTVEECWVELERHAIDFDFQQTRMVMFEVVLHLARKEHYRES